MEEENSDNKIEKIDNINQTYSSNRTTTSKEPLNEKEKEKVKKSCCKFPTAYTILLIIEIIVFLLTYIIPKGKFDTLEYS